LLPTASLDYDLPPDRIATHPTEPRDAARLLVVRRADPGRFEHRTIRDLPDLLAFGDRLVCNTTRVLPARFRGVREDTGGRVEGLYLGDDPAGVRLLAGDAPSPFALEMLEPAADPPGAWRVRVRGLEGSGGSDAPSVLEAVGLTPLPPYILAARRAGHDPGDDRADRRQYQTVFADAGSAGSVAAPTAGLHFTPGLLSGLASRGIERTGVVLHVGAGTFKPVECETVEDHPMHAEWCAMSPGAVGEVQRTRLAGGRVIAVGTTSVRTIESFAGRFGAGESPEHLSTRLLVTPGCRFAWTDGLLTNFHLPRSTLMALVGAFLQGPDEPPLPDGTPVGVERLKGAYREAIARGYRFYSFGDAMLIL
jgi:S-adenosylmethionine:tRNA ribosyltransferase-isomerase